MELDEALAATEPEPVTAVSNVKPKRCARHSWGWTEWMPAESRVLEMVEWCVRCHKVKDQTRSRRGRQARNRGNAFEREVAKRLGARRVGQYGGSDDVSADWVSVQCKVGGYYPERIDGWLRALPANAGQLRAVVLGDAPGPGRRRRSLIVIDLDDFVAWFGKEAIP